MDVTYFLLAGAFALVVTAVFVYAKSDDTATNKLLAVINSSKSDTDKVVKTCTDLGGVINETRQWLTDLAITSGKIDNSLNDMKKEFDIMAVRQASLEKKLFLKERTLNVHLGSVPGRPLEVEVVKSQSNSTTKPKKPLLEKAGVR